MTSITDIKTKLDKMQNDLDRDLSFRKKEIIAHSQLLNSTEDESQEKFLLRFGIVLLYAHWEGFLKKGTKLVLAFYQNISQDKIPQETFTAFLSGYLQKIQHDPKSNTKNNDLISFIKDNTGQQSLKNIDIKNCFRFESNVNYDILDKIMFICCCKKDFSLKKNLIDIELVNIRHSIAHGDFVPVKIEDFIRIKNEILELLEDFKEIALNACQFNKAYTTT